MKANENITAKKVMLKDNKFFVSFYLLNNSFKFIAYKFL